MLTFVQMPETAVNKDDFAPGNKDKIRLSRKVLTMERVPIAQCVNRPSDAHFRISILAAHSTHTGAPLSWCEVVRHPARAR
jgi:hypothetical protein